MKNPLLTPREGEGLEIALRFKGKFTVLDYSAARVALMLACWTWQTPCLQDLPIRPVQGPRQGMRA
jgi:hypothetical protein